MRVLKDDLRLERLAGSGRAAPLAEGAVMLPGNERNVRILYQTAEMEVLSTETQTGRVSADVAVNFTVLYLDSGGAPRAIEAQSTQSVSIEVEQATARMRARVWGWVEEVRAEESGGRLSLGAELNVRACVLEEAQRSVVSDVEEAGPLARQELPIRVTNQAAEGRQRSLLSESYPSDRENARILFAHACTTVTAAQAAERAVNVTGEVKLLLVGTDAQTPYFTLQKTVPFAVTVEADGSRFGMQALASAHVQELTAEYRGSEDGELLQVEFILQAEVSAYRESEYTVLTDLYSTRGDGLEVKDETLDFLCGARDYREVQELALPLSFPEGSAPMHSVYGVLARPAAVELERDGGQLVAGGLVSVTLFYDGGEGLASATQLLPFQLSFPPVELDCDLCLQVCSAQALASGPESADVQLGFQLAGPAWELCSLEAVTEVEESGETEAPPAGVTLYYPAGGESLWQVGKRFHIAPEDVQRLNGGSDGPVLIYRRQCEW